MPYVFAVIGHGQCTPEEASLAQDVGRLIALRGATLICGGLGGVMEAACKGAQREGGFTVGVLPGNDRLAANQWVSLAIAAGTGQARNMSVVRSADAVIAVGGAYGTLSEIAFALDSGIPVVGIDTWSLVREGLEPGGIVTAASAVEAVDSAFRLVDERSTTR